MKRPRHISILDTSDANCDLLALAAEATVAPARYPSSRPKPKNPNTIHYPNNPIPQQSYINSSHPTERISAIQRRSRHERRRVPQEPTNCVRTTRLASAKVCNDTNKAQSLSTHPTTQPARGRRLPLDFLPAQRGVLHQPESPAENRVAKARPPPIEMTFGFHSQVPSRARQFGAEKRRPRLQGTVAAPPNDADADVSLTVSSASSLEKCFADFEQSFDAVSARDIGNEASRGKNFSPQSSRKYNDMKTRRGYNSPENRRDDEPKGRHETLTNHLHEEATAPKGKRGALTNRLHKETKAIRYKKKSVVSSVVCGAHFDALIASGRIDKHLQRVERKLRRAAQRSTKLKK